MSEQKGFRILIQSMKDVHDRTVVLVSSDETLFFQVVKISDMDKIRKFMKELGYGTC